MAVKIYDDNKTDVNVKLVTLDGATHLAVVDEFGDVVNSGYMAKITEEGICLCYGFEVKGIKNDADNGNYVNLERE